MALSNNRGSRRTFLKTTGALGAAFVAGCLGGGGGGGGDGGDGGGSDSYEILMQAGSEGSTYYTLSAPFGEYVRAESEDPSIEPTVSTTGGGSQNTRVVGSGDAEWGIAVTASLYNGYHGNAPFEQEWSNIRTTARMDAYPMFHNVRQGSDIETIHDLDGRVGAPGAPGSGTNAIHKAWMEELGIQPEWRELENEEGAQALQDGDVDFWFIFTGPHVLRAYESFDIRPIKTTEEDVNAMVESRPYHDVHTLSSDWIPQIEGEWPNKVGVNPTFFTNADQPDDLISEMMEVMFSEPSRFDQHRRNPTPFSPEFAHYTDGYDVPYHPAAQAFYEDNA